MVDKVKYTCSCCGKEHEEWPALTYRWPDNYGGLSEIEKTEIAELDSDFCVIKYPDQTDRFIRCILTQKIIDHCEALEYGLWVSLSEKSFQDYSDNYGNDNHETVYFGWLCNNIQGYKFENNIPADVVTKAGNSRPEIIPHESCEHPFVYDYYNGITKAEAARRIKAMIKGIEEMKVKKRAWWKFWE